MLVNQTLGTAEYDAILQAQRSTDPDVVIEIKYIRRGFKSAWLRESAMRIALADQLYEARLKRHSVPLLIVIFSEEGASQQSEFQRPVVFKRKSINLTKDSIYNVVEMESAAGRIMFGFNQTTGELMDVIGPCRLMAETPIPVLNDETLVLRASA